MALSNKREKVSRVRGCVQGYILRQGWLCIVARQILGGGGKNRVGIR